MVFDSDEDGLYAEQPADHAPQQFAVFGLHVHEFDTVSAGRDVADDRCRLNGSQAGANFNLQRIADGHKLRRLDESAAQADGMHARGAGMRSREARRKR